MLYPVHWLLSLLASVLRLGAGRGGVQLSTHGAMPTLYEFEACPFCKIAREAISESGISVLVRPCPKSGKRFRPRVAELGGKSQFPYFVDGDTGEGLYESADVAKAMREQAGTSRALVHWLGPLNVMLSQYSILVRLMSGMRSCRSVANEKPLVFYGTEASPSARLVKEQLCAFELEYIWHPGLGDTVRLSDPNTGDELVGARSALAHIKRFYKAS
ncbi:MAG: glutathione S-transferase N-terminal domain-containing protein [Hyphomonadaceae bacterium]